MTLPNTAKWILGAVHVSSWHLSILEKSGFPSTLHWLYWPHLQQLQWELRCLDLIWTPNVRCQNSVILISHRVASCVYWIRSHRPQVENGTITTNWTSQWSPRFCFLLRTQKNPRDLPRPPGQCVLWKSSGARTQRLQSTNQKSYSGESRNSCCQTTTIIQPPRTLPLWYYLTQLNIKQKVVAKPRILFTPSGYPHCALQEKVFAFWCTPPGSLSNLHTERSYGLCLKYIGFCKKKSK